jgi:hypothetical protein
MRSGGLQPVILLIGRIKSVNTVDISIQIPTHIWDESGCATYENPDFAAKIDSLSADFDVLILMCRSGKRSDTRAFTTSLFDAVYEIDDPNGSTGHGGFQGSSTTIFTMDTGGIRAAIPGRRTHRLFRGLMPVSRSTSGGRHIHQVFPLPGRANNSPG